MSQADPTLEAPEEPIAPEQDSLILGKSFGEVIRENLFKDAKNTVLTLVFSGVFLWTIYKAFFFVFANEKLRPDGSLVNAWRIIDDNLITFMVGTVLAGENNDTGITFAMLWAALYVAIFAIGFAVGPVKGAEIVPMSNRTKVSIGGPMVLAAVVLINYTDTITPKILIVLLPIAFFAGFKLIAFLPEAVLRRRGLILGLLGLAAFLLETNFNPVNVDDFGGLLLTINAAFISIIACFPIGVLMALARRSSFPLIRPMSVAYIELIRGVPLISLLFMGAFALTLFLPPGMDGLPKTIRSIIMITLFSAAYVAEIVRGGLQSVANGQTEAGQAVGLSPITITRRIVLPQALRNSIPALVGQFIALLKDTTLLIIIGQFDLLGVSDPLLASPEYQAQGYTPEVYAFVAFILWVICFSMSRASQRLETKLGVGTR